MTVTDIGARQQSGCEPYQAPSSAEQANLAESDLLVRMSHEMRTPLSAILGFAQLMQSGRPSLTDSQRKSITRILQAGWYLEKLIRVTRDLALIASGTLSLSLESVTLATVMLDCQAMMESQAQVRGVRLSVSRCDTPCAVSADRNRLREVLEYLLSAAIEYSEMHGEIVVDCETHNSEWVRIKIRDAGAGSSVERLTRSFQLCAMDGAGIGLQLARRLVELMGGAIGAQSHPGTRNTLCIDLKRNVDELPETLGVAFNTFRNAATNTIKG